MVNSLRYLVWPFSFLILGSPRCMTKKLVFSSFSSGWFTLPFSHTVLPEALRKMEGGAARLHRSSFPSGIHSEHIPDTFQDSTRLIRQFQNGEVHRCTFCPDFRVGEQEVFPEHHEDFDYPLAGIIIDWHLSIPQILT